MTQFLHTRLAPSPTGALHLGHARTFLLTWWTARQSGKRIYMRMEDLDAGRAKPESVSQAYADLRWLGMDWDGYGEPQSSKPETKNGDLRAVVQSERLGVYREVLEELWRRGAVYPCTCRRRDIVEAVAGSASAPHEGEGHVRYRGTCRGVYQGRTMDETLGEAVVKSGLEACLRLKVPEGAVGFEDLVAGPQMWDVAREVGDFPLTRFAGHHGALPPAYQLACVVDDHAMGIDLVMRGDDLLSSTPRQILLYRALGWDPPTFAHVPLVIGADGKRLAKRHGESRIAQFREHGVPAEKVVGWAAWRSGQIESLREISAREVLERFDLGRVPRERIVLGDKDLEWLVP